MITYYSANRLLDYNFGGSAYSQPSTYYFGLTTNNINIDGTGKIEPTGGMYSRVSLLNTKSNWTTASSASLSNSNPVQFAESTASWGTIVQVFMADDPTAGNIWWYDYLTPARTVASATTVLFSAGAIVIQMTNP